MNVGKSTLFNALAKQNKALIFDRPGVTRDCLSADVSTPAGGHFAIIDTPGFNINCKKTDELASLMNEHTILAAKQADLLIFLVDGKAGLSSDDANCFTIVRGLGRRMILAVNKSESKRRVHDSEDFFSFGVEPFFISAEHNVGLAELVCEVEKVLRQIHGEQAEGAAADGATADVAAMDGAAVDGVTMDSVADESEAHERSGGDGRVTGDATDGATDGADAATEANSNVVNEATDGADAATGVANGAAAKIAVARDAAEAVDGAQFLHFRTLTLVPFDARLVDFSQLTTRDKEWLCEYHKRVEDQLAPLLSVAEKAWLHEYVSVFVNS
jgi:small GTP-binding protein